MQVNYYFLIKIFLERTTLKKTKKKNAIQGKFNFERRRKLNKSNLYI